MWWFWKIFKPKRLFSNENELLNKQWKCVISFGLWYYDFESVNLVKSGKTGDLDIIRELDFKSGYQRRAKQRAKWLKNGKTARNYAVTILIRIKRSVLDRIKSKKWSQSHSKSQKTAHKTEKSFEWVKDGFEWLIWNAFHSFCTWHSPCRVSMQFIETWTDEIWTENVYTSFVQAPIPIIVFWS